MESWRRTAKRRVVLTLYARRGLLQACVLYRCGTAYGWIADRRTVKVVHAGGSEWVDMGLLQIDIFISSHETITPSPHPCVCAVT
jgi:hypothetical protein